MHLIEPRPVVDSIPAPQHQARHRMASSNFRKSTLPSSRALRGTPSCQQSPSTKPSSRSFWPEKIVNFNCPDDRFQFTNLHALGHKGVIVAHVFNGSGFANGFFGLSDHEVVNAAVCVLRFMFPKSKSEEARTYKGVSKKRQFSPLSVAIASCKKPVESS